MFLPPNLRFSVVGSSEIEEGSCAHQMCVRLFTSLPKYEKNVKKYLVMQKKKSSKSNYILRKFREIRRKIHVEVQTFPGRLTNT